MVHRIELSTTLLIAVRKQGTSNFQPKVAGIKIDARPAIIFEKGMRSVDAQGNIIRRNSKEEVAA